MPPSPALRCSPGRELTGKKHRRGHSIEYGILFRDKEDDLALFSDMQEKERDGFLLQSSDDLEDAFSTKLKHFSEFTIPVQGESSRLLFAADGDKNDYDWLLTPPDTPLFPSLDDEPPSVSVGSRGRPRSQISLSRSSTLEKSRRSSKGSASPNRLSMSPQADNMHQIRGRSSSAQLPSPASGRRSATPVRRASPTPGKPSGPISRSSTPTSRRMSTGSTTMASPAIRGTSPVRSSRGNSASPKVKMWQSNIPGFSLDAPPNLRTSLDRPASYVRGSSPASRNGRDAASTQSRQSVSPSASRSVSSSHSHERDRFSSHSKGSVASSGDDDFQSLQSVSVVGSEHAVSKRASLSPNNRTSRSSKLLSPSSAPRRPFESALRQMDHRKSHHTMFRPLASSLPSTDIYSGKGASSYHHIMLRHSSATVGSNSISGQVTGFTPDTIESDPIPVSETEVEKLAYPNKHGETTTFTMVDLLNERSRHESPFSDQLGDMDKGNAIECVSSVSEVNNHVFDAENSSTNGSLHVNDDYFEGAALESMEVCERCGCHYHVTKGTRSEINICPDCGDEQNFAETVVPEITRAPEENSPEQAKRNLDENKSLVKMNLGTNLLELLPDDMAEAEIVEKRENSEQWVNSYEQRLIHLDESSVSKALEEEDVEMRNHQDKIQSSSGCDLSSICTKGTQAQLPGHHYDVKIDSSEVRDVALLIKRSSSIKSPIIQANYSSGFIRSYDGLSFSRDRSFSLRSSTETASASSSCDYGSSIRKGSHIRQQSGSIPDLEAHRYDINPKSLSSMSSSPGVSSHACQALNVTPEDNFEVFPAHMTYTYDETHQEFQPERQDLQSKKTEVINCDIGESSGSIGISTMESLINVVGVLAEYNPVIVGNGYYENEDDVANLVMSKMEIGESTVHVRSTSELEASPVTDDCFLDAQSMVQEKDGPETPRGSSTTTSDIETESCEHEILGSGFHDGLPESECNPNAVDDCSDLRSVENSMAHADSDQHNSLTPPVNEIIDEATVLVECPSGKETKSLTLEEATDAILFCSSIVHDLTYQAATLAIDKANDVQSQVYDEALHPTVTVLGKSNANRGYGRRGTKVNQSSKSGKASRKQMETDEKRALQIENDENASEEVISRNVGVAPTSKGESLKPPPKLESKCNCSIM